MHNMINTLFLNEAEKVIEQVQVYNRKSVHRALKKEFLSHVWI